MDILSLALSIIGLALGLVSAWPRLRALVTRARSAHSARAKRKIQLAGLMMADPVYFLAYAVRNSTLSFGLMWVASMLSSASTDHPALAAAALIFRLLVSFISGTLLGGVIGASAVLMRKKERSLSGGS